MIPKSSKLKQQIAVTCNNSLSRVKHNENPLQACLYGVLTEHVDPLLIAMGKVSATQTVIHQTPILINGTRTHQLN